MMKRTLLIVSILMFFGSGIFAQSLSLKHGDEVVSNDTVYLSGTITDDLLELHIKVKNLTDKEIELKVKKTEISLVEGSVNTFCWGGSCFMPTVYTSPLSTKIGANATDFNSFAGDYEPSGMEGTSIISYTFFNVQDEEDSVMVTAFYQVGTNGINNFYQADKQVNIYPNPLVGNVNVEFKTLPEKSYSIKLLNFNGQLIEELASNSKAKSYNFTLTNLPSSCVIIEITDSSGFLLRRKMLVRK